MNFKKFTDPHFPFNPKKIPFFYGWVVIGFVTILGGLGAIGRTPAISPFVEDLCEHLHLTKTQISSAFTLGSLLAGFWFPLLGRLLDAVHIRLIVPAALLGLTGILWYLCCLGGLVGVLGNGFALMVLGFMGLRVISCTLTKLIPRTLVAFWFMRKRVLVSAYSAAMIAVIVSVIPNVAYHVKAFLGWRSMWFLESLGVALICVPLAWLIIRKRPEDCGLHVDGIQEDHGVAIHDPLLKKEKVVEKAAGNYHFLKSMTFWILNLIFAMHSLLGTGTAFHFVGIGEERGVGGSVMLTLLVPVAILGIFFNLVVGTMIKRMHLKTLFILFIINIVGGLLCLCFVQYNACLVGFSLMYAMAWSLNNILLYVTWPSLFGKEGIGNIHGWVIGTNSILSAFGPFLLGCAKDVFGSFVTGVYILLGVLVLIGSLLVFARNQKVT